MVISNFHEDSEISRTNIAYEYFNSKGHDVTVLYSNYSHSLKKFRYLKNKNFIFLKTISYNSSISLRRILSYLIFSAKVFAFLRKNNFDIIYYNVPPNILSIPVSLLKRNSKIIIDILDLWPESAPYNGSFFRKISFIFFGFFLKLIRKIGIKNSDFCITESNLFFKKLNLRDNQNSQVIHLKKIQIKNNFNLVPTDEFSIVYLGNLGAIYDFESLFKIISGLRKIRPVKLHIIGLGPISKWFFNKLNILKIDYEYHGASFDEDLKKEIISKCWFGYNGYKQDIKVGLSYKSIDYISYGVPLINSVKFDTEYLVNSENIGFNFHPNKTDLLVKELSMIDLNEITRLKTITRNLFIKRFSFESYCNEMDEVMSKIG